MSMVISMLRRNIPLHQWRQKGFAEGGGYHGRHKDDMHKLAMSIIRQCGHPDVIELVAKEFASFPELLRIEFRTTANDQQASSGNVRKGLQRLNDRLNGELMRVDNGRFVQTRVETTDGVSYRRRRINESVAGAHRKYQKV